MYNGGTVFQCVLQYVPKDAIRSSKPLLLSSKCCLSAEFIQNLVGQ